MKKPFLLGSPLLFFACLVESLITFWTQKPMTHADYKTRLESRKLSLKSQCIHRSMP